MNSPSQFRMCCLGANFAFFSAPSFRATCGDDCDHDSDDVPCSMLGPKQHETLLFLHHVSFQWRCKLQHTTTRVEEDSQTLVRGAPPGSSHQPIHKTQLDVDHPLVGNVSQPWVAVQDAHVLLNLGLGYQPHLLLAHTVVQQLRTI